MAVTPTSPKKTSGPGVQNSAYRFTPGVFYFKQEFHASMRLQWQYSDPAPKEPIERLASELAVPTVVARILVNRGIEAIEDAKTYFRADYSNLYDPFLMADMDVATDRLLKAINKKEHILIFGDYDVDGATATAMMILLFRKLGHPVDFHIPNRIRDGYGFNREAIEKAHKQGISLIISVDCGITAMDEIARARELGMDVIVCDHHRPGPELPAATAILNPKRTDCPYPFKELAGVGVSFKLAQALVQKLGADQDTLLDLMDLVAIGSAADIVPLVDENRILVRRGLQELASTRNLGVRALLKSTKLMNTEIGTGQIIFILAPRINAVGRMGDASRAVKLLTTRDENEANRIAEILEKENRQRRSIDEETFREAVEMLEAQFDPENDSAFVISAEGWHPGVIGIVASRIVDRYYRPTVMITTDDGVGKGSARSIPGFSIYDALESCSDLMIAFGGHKYAAGLTISSENIDLLRQRLKAYSEKALSDEHLTRKLHIDGEIRFSEIDGKLLRILKMMAPYGPQNLRPIFSSKGIRIVGSPAIVGSNHLRFKAAQDGKVIDAIGFNLGGLLHRLLSNRDDVEIAYLIEENHWQGRVSTQLRIKDIR